MKKDSPVLEYRTILTDSGDPGYVNRLLVGTPVTGLVRVEFMQARYGQIIPINWSMVQMLQWMDGYMPYRYQVADAQNLIVRDVVHKEFEWLLLIEHDVLLPADGFIRINEYIRSEEYPIVSGLYYTRFRPSEPLVFKGRGNGAFIDFELGDKVMCDGVPTGCLLIHAGILREMWKESPEYAIGEQITRRVFNTPRDLWYDPETNMANATSGTSDLEWCTRIMEKEFFKKAGWDKFQEMDNPFLVDTEIFCRHIGMDGVQYP